MRIVRNGAALGAQAGQTPSVSKAVTEPASSAVVRLSGRAGRLPTRTVATSAPARAMAAVNPARAADDNHLGLFAVLRHAILGPVRRRTG